MPRLFRIRRSTNDDASAAGLGIVRGGTSSKATGMKTDELESYRTTLQNLRARLRGDLDQMTDEALRRDQPESSGNLSNVPLHMADVGTENYDQEFTLEPDRERAEERLNSSTTPFRRISTPKHVRDLRGM